jgi:hypothetical protein
MRRLGFAVAAAASITVLGVGLIPAIAQERGTALYLAGPGFPESIFRTDEPIADHVTDLDRGRDPAPGLTLTPGGDPTRETDDALHQDFALEVSQFALGSSAELDLWVAAPAPVEAVIVAHLLDCDQFGLDCRDLGGVRLETTVSGNDFQPQSLMIPNAPTVFAPDRTLVLSITNDGEGDIWLGYDARSTPSGLTLELTAPPSPTTTTSTPITPTTTTVGPVPVATYPVVTAPPSTVPPPTVAPLVTTTTTIGTTTTNPLAGSFDEDVLARLVFDYSMATGAVTAGGEPSASALGWLLGVWGPFGSTMGAALPWLAALAAFGIVTAYVATRNGTRE